jgi:CBS domain-containing protein
VLERSSPGNTIRPDGDAAKALSKMSESGISRLLVADGSRLVGIVSMRDLLNFLVTKLDLEEASLPGMFPNVRQ